MKRRDAIATLLALGAASASLRGYTQMPSQVRRVAWMGLGSPDAPSAYFDALRSGMRDLGWREGQNLVLAPFGSTGFPEDAERAAREMTSFDPEVIVAQELLVFAAQRVHPATPVVFGFSGDPVQAKLVQSYAHPAGNLTGMTYLALDLVAKRIELLKELVPHMRRTAVLARPQHPGEQYERSASEEAAAKHGISLVFFPIRDVSEIEQAFAAMTKERCDSLVVFPDFFLFINSTRIARLAIEAKLPAVSGWAPFADNGVLLTYGPNIRDLYRGLARYVNRILRGAKPGELPVELPRSIELVLNHITARRLGLSLPQSILVRADRVIE